MIPGSSRLSSHFLTATSTITFQTALKSVNKITCLPIKANTGNNFNEPNKLEVLKLFIDSNINLNFSDSSEK